MSWIEAGSKLDRSWIEAGSKITIITIVTIVTIITLGMSVLFSD